MEDNKSNKELHKVSFETFRRIDSWHVINWIKDDPFCLGSYAYVKRYKVLIEEIEEPDEVYRERLKKLWEECDDRQHRRSLKEAAKSMGFVLNKDDYGKSKKR